MVGMGVVVVGGVAGENGSVGPKAGKAYADEDRRTMHDLLGHT